MSQAYQHSLRQQRAAERGVPSKDAPVRIALVYPSPYSIAASSLGFHAIQRVINDIDDVCAHRAVLPEVDTKQLATLECQRPVADYHALGISVAYEMEIAGVIKCLRLSGMAPLRADRPSAAQLVFAGGPLTFSNPAPLGPFVDVICLGEGEDLTTTLIETWRACDYDRQRTAEALAEMPGYYVPHLHGDDVPAIARASDKHLPARSLFTSPLAELSDMYLTEAVRGCSRGCNYCVMRRSTNGGMRMVTQQDVINNIPDHATRVGLVGASVTDHPGIADIVHAVADTGREVGISSLRADRLTDRLVSGLARGGYKTLTVAADGASQKLRLSMDRKTNDTHLLHTAELAKAHKLRTVKLYMMVGLPNETDADFDELADLTRRLRKIHPRIAFGVAPFVAKRNTPLDGAPFAGISVVNKRLSLMRKKLGKLADVRPTSARWAWVEYMLAQGGQASGEAVLAAEDHGGRFADYKRALSAPVCAPRGPVARVPSAKEKIAAHRMRVIV